MGDYRDDPIQTAGHVWQEELEQEQATQVESPRTRAVEPQERQPGPDLGDDPDGDIEGYDGPLGRPGGYCQTIVNGKHHVIGGEPTCPQCSQWHSAGGHATS